ncbi:MAG: tetratricopeptide repeat protein [Alphaproteobacteria bacterium]|nr:tetratricopeptide repeat protein [Alphaproteobacteria bacterium]
MEIDPGYALGYRALGLALSASGAIEEAIEAYNRAVTIDPDAWEALINLSDLAEYQGDADLSLSYIEQGFEAMSRVYEDQAVRIRPWYSITGNSIARDHLARGDQASAEMWYRRVLHWDPLNAESLTGLAALLRARGDMVSARETCAVLADELDRTACLEG